MENPANEYKGTYVVVLYQSLEDWSSGKSRRASSETVINQNRKDSSKTNHFGRETGIHCLSAMVTETRKLLGRNFKF